MSFFSFLFWLLFPPIRRVLRVVLGPPLTWFVSKCEVNDPWKRHMTCAGPNFRLRDFRWYLEGESAVSITSIDDVCAWLRQCEYADDDVELFKKRIWRHPRKFEFLRRGDSLDHALWAWRQLVRLGVDAEFVIGRSTVRSPDEPEHAWVVFRDVNGVEHVLESAAKDGQPMVHAAADIRARYVPHFAVNGARRTFTFDGALLEVRRGPQSCL